MFVSALTLIHQFVGDFRDIGFHQNRTWFAQPKRWLESNKKEFEMKRFWHGWLAVVAVTTMVGTTNAQWNQSPEIGSYQSILARSGHGHNGMIAPPEVPGTLPGQLITAPRTNAAPAMAGPIVQDGNSCGGCVTSGPGMVRPGMVVGNVGYAANSAAGCGTNVYQPGANIGLGTVRNAARNVNRVGSIYGLVLRRNYEDQLRVGSNAGQQILSDDVQHGDLSGLGFSLITRSADGNGWEVGYWGIDDDVDVTFAAPDFISIGGLANLNLGGFSVFDIYNNADNFGIYRDSEINSLELNLLRNGGNYSTRRGRNGNFELLGGFRMFQFDESYRIVGNGSTPYPATTEYALEAENLLVGGQLGARSEVCLTNRMRLASGINFGLFNNFAETRQRVFDQAGTAATVNGGPAAGRDFDYMDSQNDIAILGELRLGLIYQLTQKLRANVGYRAFGVSGVALAVDQVPMNFEDPGLLQQSRTNGSLLLHGLYFGAESCF